MQLFIGAIQNHNPKDRQMIKTIKQTIQKTTGQKTQANWTIQKTRQKIENHDTRKPESAQKRSVTLTRLRNVRRKTQG